MAYRLMGSIHARAAIALRRTEGQGTVEYVALILLVAVVLAGVVAATRKTSLSGGEIGETIVKQIKRALENVS